MTYFSQPSLRTRIKICGITRLEDALTASALGVDAVGFVFYKNSPRYIEPMKAAAIIRKLPPFVSAVGLFVNPSQQEIDEVLSYCPLGVIQLHGDESPEFCQAQSRRVIKAIAVHSPDDLTRAKQYDCPVLLDAKAPKGVFGGTGHSFDWSLLSNFTHDYPLMLAGGLNIDNIESALSHRQWFALDVSSGVEISPGIKNQAKMKTLIERVNTGSIKVEEA
ncbi:MAG: phosphoribosylanthranilate isomerase [Mariprofundaceae bacterium]|nr:phosphoribosylanthranilate isomerase [Mariprofundaceae bacterium]